MQRAGARPPVTSEASNGESNLRSFVAMALRGTDADSGSNQFFINVVNNDEVLDVGPPPFTVFAQVVEGMNVADALSPCPTAMIPVWKTCPTRTS